MKINRILGVSTVAAGVTIGVFLTVGSAADAKNPMPPNEVAADVAAVKVEEAKASASESEAPYLRDGRVSQREYMRAVKSTTDCIENGGQAAAAERGIDVQIEITQPVLTPDAFTANYSIMVKGDTADLTPEAAEAFDGIQTSCVEEHLDAVERVYQLGLKSNPSYIQKQAVAARECFADAGKPMPASVEQLRADVVSLMVNEGADIPDPVWDCIDANQWILGEPTADPNG
jgi:hypothetical protein